MGKRAGSSTPLPSWRLMTSRSRSPASAFRSTESPNYELHQCASGRSKQAPVSARKLAATLWEMNELPSRRVKEGLALEERKSRKEMKGREKTTRSVHSGSLPPHLSDPSHSPVSEVGFCSFPSFLNWVLYFCLVDLIFCIKYVELCLLFERTVSI